VTTEAHWVARTGHEVMTPPQAVGALAAVQTVAWTGQVVATAGHWVRAVAQLVNWAGQVVATATVGQTVATLVTQTVALAGHWVYPTGQTVGCAGKMVGLNNLSVLTIRSIRLFGVGSPGIWMKILCFP